MVFLGLYVALEWRGKCRIFVLVIDPKCVHIKWEKFQNKWDSGGGLVCRNLLGQEDHFIDFIYSKLT